MPWSWLHRAKTYGASRCPCGGPSLLSPLGARHVENGVSDPPTSIARKAASLPQEPAEFTPMIRERSRSVERMVRW